jgi:hypothetical protein
LILLTATQPPYRPSLEEVSMSIRICVTVFALTCLTGAASAQESADEPVEPGPMPAAEYVLESGAVLVVRGEERQQIDLPGEAVAILVRGEELYVALGADGAALFDVSDPSSPTLVRRIDSGREQVTGFIVVDDEVWMRIVSTAAVPVKGGSPAGGAAAVVVTAEPAKKDDTTTRTRRRARPWTGRYRSSACAPARSSSTPGPMTGSRSGTGSRCSARSCTTRRWTARAPSRAGSWPG